MFKHLMQRLDTRIAPSRRGFLKFSLGAGAGLVVGVHLPAPASAAAGGDSTWFNPFVSIAPDSTVTVFIKHLDMGQGVYTGLTSLVAEELNAAHDQMRAEFAPADASLYNNLTWGTVQGTGGSSSIANAYEQYRRAGAFTRDMLLGATGKEWKVPVAELTIADGVISHSSGKSATFGEMAELANKQPVPDHSVLKSKTDFKFIGKSFPRLDTEAKSTGKAVYTQDLHLDGMLTAVIAHPPKFGASVASFDDSEAMKVRGVDSVVQVPQGVAVIASSTWAAIKGREALSVTWDESKAETRGSDEIIAGFKAALDGKGTMLREDAGIDDALSGAATVVEREYTFPFLAHAAMEPMNAIVQISDGGATLWTGSQIQTVDQGTVAAIAGVDPANVRVETVFAGGSFGRRALPNAQHNAEAAAIAKAHGKGVPIKLVYTREDDMRGGYYRPVAVHRVRAGLDAGGNIVGWDHKIATQSILKGSPFEGMLQGGPDFTMFEGAFPPVYAIPAARFELFEEKTGIPVLWWRSVGSTHTAYVMETMIDELAKAAGQDPVAFRLALLKDHPRHRGVLELAAEKAGWSNPPAEGRFRGVAVHESFNSFVAEVAEVSLQDGRIKVEKVTCAVDCGVAVNPDIVAAQMEGGIGFGLGAAMREKLNVVGGEVEDGNFDTYTPLRITDMPQVEVHIVASEEAPTGVGEPGVPPIAPAVANAYAAASGKRITSLPFADHDIV
ncbi:MAG: xanthine dehydrogenase family protein molybdopterin-binding subunit [Rhodobiaceae bacterium]|nr:xanthine dehydrogenase family protein molybdopterin-binding subunit [Rhodobiaceae bacterium]MCC0049027.1 xanthine dehydrogenase family protein molybdopterin-binding subunit [Rhodobiaceae bacterium]